MNKIIALIILPLALIGCGGGDSTELNETSNSSAPPPETAPPPEGTTTTTGTAKRGIITGFGSVFLDGERYNTDSTNIVINGREGQSIESLRVGMNINLVSDEGGETLSAQQIEYDSGLKGFVQSIDRVNQFITVSGVEVFYDDLTHFIAISLASLSVGDRVEVSGYALVDGQFQATYIEKESDTDNGENEYITGLIQNLDLDNMRFSIGSVSVDYSNSRVEGALANQVLVKVEGTFNDNDFVAIEVEVENYDNHDKYEEAEIEGVITGYDNIANTLDVNGQQFELSDSVTFSNGSSTDLKVGVLVELKGSFVNGSFVINHIEFENEYSNDGVLKGAITAIDYEAMTLTVGGNTYFANSQTRYEAENDQYFSFTSLQLNDFVEVVYAKKEERFTILKIEREREEERYEESEIKGQIIAFSNSEIEVSGLLIPLSQQAICVVDDTRVALTEFINQLASGLYVEINGTFDTDGIFSPAKFELEIQDNDDDGDDDREGGSGYVELEGRITDILSATSFTLGSYTVDIKNATKLEIDDRRVSVDEFIAALQINDVVEVEGTWSSNNVINAYEAELEDD